MIKINLVVSMRYWSFNTLALYLLLLAPLMYCSGRHFKRKNRQDTISTESSGSESSRGRTIDTTSVRTCIPLHLTRGTVRVSLVVDRRGVVESSHIIVDCDSPGSSLSGTDTLSSIPLRECLVPGSDVVNLINKQVEILCTADQVYKRFVKENLNLANSRPVRIVHIRVSNSTSEMRILRKRFERDDLRLALPVDSHAYVDMNIARYARHPSIAFINERLSSVQERLVSSNPSTIDPRNLAISPIVSEYVRSDNGTAQLIQVRSYQDGKIIVGFRRELSQHELELRTNSTSADGIRHVHTNSIDPEGFCCFCDEPKQSLNTTLVKLCCFHEYHESCIRKWIFENEKSQCPECRSNI